MAEYEYEELLSFAEAAFANKQYEEALKYYAMALTERPDDLYLLSRAGTVAVAVGRYKDAFNFFSHAVEVDPDNGDNYYNLGNAYYFAKDYANCLDMYTKAETLGCSTEVMNKLYFQKAMLCSARGDTRAALLYLEKYEKAVAESAQSIDPRVLSEKVRLYIILKDFEQAELNAAKLVNVQPTLMNNHMLYYSLLMTQKKYPKAELALKAAEEFAVGNDSDRYILMLQKAAFYTELAEIFIDDKSEFLKYEDLALEIYNELLKAPKSVGSKAEVKLNLANLHMKAKRYEDAAKLLKSLLSPDDVSAEKPDEEKPAEIKGGTLRAIMARRAAKRAESNEKAAETVESAEELSDDLIERAAYMLMACSVSNEDYKLAIELAEGIQDSENVYYRYFSKYCIAYAVRELAKVSDVYSKEDGERKYAETIAFYRSCMMKDPRDKYAIVLRARLYAEQGSYAKADEMTKLLGAEEREALLGYIEECKRNNSCDYGG